ncbi:XRE family transcriptional regulator [Pontibacillus chungwhensis BH030062]|uniref:XRE family transcriptional regulator n=1 Tax=Pontibacillus chungwhensis BH030062 TaxID=1385513 RepID=A0A0A2UU05_9BACI|nr:response regulator transcription factor [Pontibacillus chungwhensis]KGP90243.1 XRE family transcriptional regulator [Pontibacillus chungwhensis BH030062]
MSNLLLVDDEPRMLDLLELYLSPHGYTCTKVQSGKEAIRAVEEKPFDLVLLDVMMPKYDGWKTCEDLRSISEVPIIMVTARDQKTDIVKGLNMGADDYVTKPFDEDELLARVKALLRRTSNADQIEVDGLMWDGEKYKLSYNGHFIPVTPKEFAMIGHLMRNPERVFSREHLIDIVWGINSETEGRTIDSHVRNIREKVRQTGFPIDDYFQTVWGVGYKWVKGTGETNS